MHNAPTTILARSTFDVFSLSLSLAHAIPFLPYRRLARGIIRDDNFILRIQTRVSNVLMRAEQN